MPRHRQLAARCEDAHPHVTTAVGREDKGRFRERHFGGNPLHTVGGNILRRSREDRELVPLESGLREDVEMQVTHGLLEMGKDNTGILTCFREDAGWPNV